MIQKDILYLNLIRLLKGIVESPEIDIYNATLADEALEQKFGLLIFDGFSNEIKVLEKQHQAGFLYSNYSKLLTIIESLDVDFPAFVISRRNEILLSVALAQAISNQVTDVTEDTPILISNEYDLICIDTVLPSIPFKYFYYYNTTSLRDSIILFSIEKIKEIVANILADQIDLRLLFVVLSKVGLTNEILTGNNYVLTRQGQAANLNRIKSALLLHVVSDGKSMHLPDLYTDLPLNPWRKDIQVNRKYQQFLDTIYILSEYNYNQDILNKYLRLYQVFEDFMYKSSLVKLEREYNGNIFSIRDFKKMYEYIADREFEALHKLIEEVFEEDYTAQKKFRTYIFEEFTALTSIIPLHDINIFLKKFRIKSKKNNYTYDKIVLQNIDIVFSQLIYSLRNSIVHNKTTEFHLTYNTVDVNIATFIKKFMLPKMETIIFFLTIESTTNLVRFSNETLKIWKDD